jgi:hypothetical protein
MSLSDADRELLMRFLDGPVTDQETHQAHQLLRANEAARSFLQEVAEQAVLIADLDLLAAGRVDALRFPSMGSVVNPALPESTGMTWMRRTWAVRFAALMLMLSVAVSGYSYWSNVKPLAAQITNVRGIVQLHGSDGQSRTEVDSLQRLVAGDVLESRSCDGWIELKFDRDSLLTIAAHSGIRVLRSPPLERRFELLTGTLWVSPGSVESRQTLFIRTPVADIEAANSLMNIQTSDTQTVVRVHQGQARVTLRLSGESIVVPAAQQVNLSLASGFAPSVIPQPKPVDSWSLQLPQGLGVSYGTLLPSAGSQPVRILSAPLLWPLQDREPILLHVVGVAAWKCSEQPLQLSSQSRLRFRGRTQRPQLVRFGFSTQKLLGVFAGKFETDVAADRLGPAGEVWEIEIPLSDFTALHPQPSSSPFGLELTDVYALTVVEDAGLEIHHIELLSGPDPAP